MMYIFIAAFVLPSCQVPFVFGSKQSAHILRRPWFGRRFETIQQTNWTETVTHDTESDPNANSTAYNSNDNDGTINTTVSCSLKFCSNVSPPYLPPPPGPPPMEAYGNHSVLNAASQIAFETAGRINTSNYPASTVGRMKDATTVGPTHPPDNTSKSITHHAAPATQTEGLQQLAKEKGTLALIQKALEDFVSATRNVLTRETKRAAERTEKFAVVQRGTRKQFRGISERTLERNVERGGKRMVERSSERLLERGARSSERLLERGGKRIAGRGSERLLERGAEQSSERLLKRGTERILERCTERGSDRLAKCGMGSGKPISRMARRTLQRGAKRTSERTLLMRMGHCLTITLPVIGGVFALYLLKTDWERLTEERKQSLNSATPSTTKRVSPSMILFLGAWMADLVDAVLHFWIAVALLRRVTNARLALAEEWSLACAIVSSVCAVMGEIMSFRLRKRQMRNNELEQMSMVNTAF